MVSRRDKAAAPGSASKEEDAAAGAALDRDILPDLVGYQLKRAQERVLDSFAAHLGGMDLTTGQFAVLVLIGANPGSTQTALAGVVGTSRSLMVRTLDRLEASGLVARAAAPGDRRSHAIALTAKGEALVTRLKEDVAAHENAVTRGLSANERESLLELLRRLNEG